ncbi:MAG: Stp1/IreP family PP2C-type Ser/Thr phosphatase [Actinomycetota bacterium]
MNTAVGVRTDVGRVREGNEDSYLAEPPLFAIADGMGGHSAGEVASETAVKVISDGAAQVSSEDPRSLARLLNNANAAIYTKAQSDSALRGMGTTCTLLMAGEGVAHLAHVGDSRAYRLRGGDIEQLTDDHTLVGRMVREGQISPEEAQHHPQRNVITNALGLDSNIAVDLREIEARAGDRLLLCSDGLSSMVSDADIVAAAESTKDPQQGAEAWGEWAREAGGEDNITVLVIDLGGEDAPAPAPMRTDTAPGHSSPAPSTSRRGRKWLGALLLLVVVVAAAYGAGNWALDNSFYVGVDESDRVTIYQGIPERIAGLTLAEPVEPSTLSLEDLPTSRHALLRQGMKVESLDEAQSTVSDLSDLAREFQDQRARGGSKA